MKYLIVLITALMALPANATQYESEKQSVQCLLTNAFYEARGEGLKGILLVSQVVINRAKRSNKTVCSVLKEPGQFSWKGRPHKYPQQFAEEFGIDLLLLLRGETVLNKSYQDVFYFHHVKLKPKWSRHLKVATVYRNHVFYKET